MTSFPGRRDSDAPDVPTPAEKTIGAVAERDLNLSASQVAHAALGAAMDGGTRLIMGANIKLKDVEVSDCDTLVVEAAMKARVMQIADSGAFKGAAEFDLAAIRGRFDGELTVRQVLVIHATGQVVGKIHYNRVVIEERGQLCGDISCAVPARASTPASSPAIT